jgi:DNA-binding Lrp family transcriptional regulator
MASTKLKGVEAIADFFGWSESKFRSRMEELKEAGVIFQEHIGTPPKLMWCAFPELLLRWVSLKAEKREVL